MPPGVPPSSPPSSPPTDPVVPEDATKPATPASSNPLIPEAKQLALQLRAFKNEFGVTGEDHFKEIAKSRPMAQVILNLTVTVQDEYNSLSDDDKRLIVAQSGLDDLAWFYLPQGWG